jgi:hypothetical protein
LASLWGRDEYPATSKSSPPWTFFYTANTIEAVNQKKRREEREREREREREINIA